MGEKGELHLPDLHISGFRGIDNLDMPRLGRVTLLVGENGVGKTTVLEAVQVYATRGIALGELLRGREELSLEETSARFELDWFSLFYGRDATSTPSIAIGPTDDLLNVSIINLPSDFPDTDEGETDYDMEHTQRGFRVTLRDNEHLFSLSRLRLFRRWPRSAEPLPEIDCKFAPAGIMDNDFLERLWNKAGEERRENLAVDPLRTVLGLDIDDVLFLGTDRPGLRSTGRRAMAGVQGYDRRVPLKSLGGGAFRLFSIALALSNSNNGILLLDEAENGLHYTTQPNFWRTVFQTAEANNVQVIATTHSSDCVRGFAQAAAECEDVEGIIIRLERDDEGLYIVDYPEDELAIAAEHNIEVR